MRTNKHRRSSHPWRECVGGFGWRRGEYLDNCGTIYSKWRQVHVSSGRPRSFFLVDGGVKGPPPSNHNTIPYLSLHTRWLM